ncbi:hypothetical protein KGG85_gp70 [Streptomyces phage Tefunt]|uniref:Uncharacterized protein n=1 Tax=Streptomyces phage Tefunt TaxID=2041209 RepID=A0A291LHZ2_9CAUD|nr:hypothetical protein KGG85_gp70 [Streptomyces phage Tefunt]ATI19010.1 hypothetical protein SEA_TEFUNT_70 [Streptomyces phage Tefunt]AXH70274.1 hypothetical protein SEA_HAIZUM_70 [Streptomyces phage Haizum]QAY15812.1 hypothetical protein SEA_NISHIKIGOI_71 [Streptomyces phage Nishikigoi]
MSEVDERFNRWAERLRTIFANPDEDARQAEMDNACDEMWIEDPRLIAYWENCIDGCCPTGELVLARLVHPQVSAPAMVRVFPELIRTSRTHRAVIFEEN